MAALEAQRDTLGNSVVDTALAPLRERIVSLQAAQAAGQQRKQVTVLFGDISGFTALSEFIDPEEVTHLMNLLWQRIDKAILTHGGTIDKHVGDGVMALWGAGRVREDDPEQAIRAALEIQKEIRITLTQLSEESGWKYSKTQPTEIGMRIGLNTGPVLLGTVGTMGEFTAMGDAVNLASRLEKGAPSGGVLISYDTYRHVRGLFSVEALSPVKIKGRSEPVQTYLVTGIKPRSFRLGTRGVEGVETRMIGREEPLRQMQDILAATLETWSSHALTIVGDAGVGKSRLLFEFRKWVELRPEDFWVFNGWGRESASHQPYALLRDVFSFRFGLADSDALAETRQKFEQGVAQFMPQDPEAAMKAHIIGHLIGFDYSDSPFLRGGLEDAGQIRRRAFHYLTQFFAEAARHSCVILYLEDLHWADEGSLDALGYLLENIPSQPVLVVGLTRPSLFERRLTWGVGHPRLDLSPLTPDQSRMLVEEILQKALTVPHELCDLVVKGAEGNPYYLEELIKMLMDQKVIVPDEEVWRIEPWHMVEAHLPPTLVGVLQARLDGLLPEELEILQRAAIIGRTFWDSAVSFLSLATHSPNPNKQATVRLIPDTATRKILEALQRKDMIQKQETSAFTFAQEYSFQHALLRDVTYETVLKRQRKDYHLLAGAWLVSRSGDRVDEFAMQIAEHLERGGSYRDSIQYLERAGEKALKVSALRDALAFFSRAVGVIDTEGAADPELLDARPKLILKQAEAWFYLGDYGHAREMLQYLLEEELPASLRVSVFALLGEVHSRSGEYAQASHLLAEALPLARAANNFESLAWVLYSLGDVNWRLGQTKDAVRYLEEGLRVAETIEGTSQTLFILNRLGTLATDLDEAERYYHQVYQLATESGHRERAMVALNNLASAALERDDPAAARPYQQQALGIAREIGAQDSTALHLLNLTYAEIRLGNLEEARQSLKEGLSTAYRIGAWPWVVVGLMNYADLAAAEGDYARGLALYGLAQQHPAFSSDNQRLMEIALARWGLPAENVSTGLAAGEQMDFEQVIQALLNG